MFSSLWRRLRWSPCDSQRRPRRRRAVPTVEPLEDRCVPATFVVNTSDDVDDGVFDAVHGSLREAINAANALAGFDHIHFGIPGAGPHIISPTSALPVITGAVEIDGYTQAGALLNTLTVGTNAVLKIMLNGGLLTGGESGLVFSGGGSTVRGLVIGNFGYPDVGAPGLAENVPAGGLVLLGSGSNHIEGNFIGTDFSGSGPRPNLFYGIFIASSNNVIGGAHPSQRNLISGNQGFGIQITARDLPGGSLYSPAEFNQVQGNLIGTDRSGLTALANTGGGVMIRAFAKNNTIGGTSAAARNILSGNGGPFAPFGDPSGPYQDWPEAPYPVSGGHGDGVHVENLALIAPNVPVPNNVIGNYIGTNALGTAALPNRHRGVVAVFTNSVDVIGNVISGNAHDGVAVGGTFTKQIVIQGNRIGTDPSGVLPIGNGGDGVLIHACSDNTVGGAFAGQGNLIAFNRAAGVVVRGHPLFPSPAGNRIQRNSIHSNGLLGIDLLANPNLAHDGPTPNDFLDPDLGPNHLQNFPSILVAQAGASTHVIGFLSSLPQTRFELEFFASAAPDPSGFGEGARFLGAINVTTNIFGFAVFNVFLPGGSVVGEWLTATATDILRRNTSEFSGAVQLGRNPFVGVPGGLGAGALLPPDAAAAWGSSGLGDGAHRFFAQLGDEATLPLPTPWSGVADESAPRMEADRTVLDALFTPAADDATPPTEIPVGILADWLP